MRIKIDRLHIGDRYRMTCSLVFPWISFRKDAIYQYELLIFTDAGNKLIHLPIEDLVAIGLITNGGPWWEMNFATQDGRICVVHPW